MLLKFIIGLVIATTGWIVFIIIQQYTYSEPDQVYLMGTIISYSFAFFFLCVVMFFIFSFIKHRNNPDRLKRRFLVFAAFYLISSPFVIMSFDNYLLVTPKGVAYNEFFRLDDRQLKQWIDIEQVVLDYQIVHIPLYKDKDFRLKYIIYFKDGRSVDLNNLNSPLYDAEQLKAIHRVLLKHKVPIKIAHALPEEIKNTDSFTYEMFHFK
jgi:amino acid transporter